MDTNTIKMLIKERFPEPHEYREPHLSKVISDIVGMTPPVRLELEYFLENGEVVKNPVEIEGYSADRLIKEHGMNPVGAYLTLEWLTREPEKAKKALLRGHDRVVFRGQNT